MCNQNKHLCLAMTIWRATIVRSKILECTMHQGAIVKQNRHDRLLNSGLYRWLSITDLKQFMLHISQAEPGGGVCN